LVCYLLLASDTKFPLKRIVTPLALLDTATIPFLVFRARGGSIEDSDRAHFLSAFLSETHDWTIVHWLFGNPPITPLSDNICSSLSYYQLLFSSSGDGHCYSVILHLFALRVLLDFGVVGLIVSCVLPLFLLRRAGLPVSLALLLVVIAQLNGLSVSGLNNEFIVLPLFIAVGLAKKEPSMPAPGSFRLERALLKSGRS
jgi:hypothetical protein